MSEENIIIKKVKKSVHKGPHGGSWKIAYADFMTTLMTFFLVMWLISMTMSQQKKEEVVEYYKNLNFFPTANMPKKKQVMGSYHITQTIPLDAANKNIVNPKEIKKKLKEIIEAQLAEFKQYITLTEEEEGVRIDIADPEGGIMFAISSPQLQPGGEKILAALSEAMHSFDNKLIIEGHTDARSYPTSEYTNWELSTERASSARKELEKDSISPDRIAMIAGYAATKPIIIDDATDSRNRRISILVLNPSYIVLDENGKK
jgi:chemotaxis protein MotB